MNRRTALIISTAVALIIVVAVFAAVRRSTPPPATQTAVAPQIATAIALRGVFAARLTAQGRVGPPAGSTAKLAFPQAGILRTVEVRVGDRVGAGTVLAELDRATLAASLRQVDADAAAAAGQFAGGSLPNAAIRGAQARFVLAQSRARVLAEGGPAAQSDQISAAQTLRQAQLKVAADGAAVARAETLLAGGVIAAKDLAAARSQLAADGADVRTAEVKLAAARAVYGTSLRQARADVAAAQTDLLGARAQTTVLGAQAQSAAAKATTARIAYEQGVLRAPNDGVVLAILKHSGEAIDPSAAVIELGPGAANTITLTVPADQARRITVGDSALLSLTQTGRRVGGRVTAVVPAVDPATQSATVTVSGAPADAIPGDAVSATITVSHITGIVVPSSAIVEDPQTGRTVVFIRKSDGSFSPREVAVRAGDDRSAVLASGLRGGERIATQGAYELLAPAGG